MNNLFASAVLETTFAGADFEVDTALIFVDDVTYEFVGGGMAANGI